MAKNYKEILSKFDSNTKNFQDAAKAAKTAIEQLKKLQEEAKKLKGSNVKDSDYDA